MELPLALRLVVA